MSTWGNQEIASISKQLSNANIHILMLDPTFLENNPETAKALKSFFDRPDDLIHSVKGAFEKVREFAEEYNSRQGISHRIYLRTYDHFQTFSMVMIDPDSERSGEMIVEFFIYQSRRIRPRFRFQKTSEGFRVFRDEIDNLWNRAKPVVW